MTDACPICGHAIETPDLILSPEQHLIVHRKKVARLTGREWALFDVLYQSRRRVVPKDTIMQRIYASDNEDPDWAVVSQFLFRLRPKLSRVGIVIDCVRNEGYILNFRAD
jgi:DNA-binding response OmpR family regulator